MRDETEQNGDLLNACLEKLKSIWNSGEDSGWGHTALPQWNSLDPQTSLFSQSSDSILLHRGGRHGGLITDGGKDMMESAAAAADTHSDREHAFALQRNAVKESYKLSYANRGSTYTYRTLTWRRGGKVCLVVVGGRLRWRKKKKIVL